MAHHSDLTDECWVGSSRGGWGAAEGAGVDLHCSCPPCCPSAKRAWRCLGMEPHYGWQKPPRWWPVSQGVLSLPGNFDLCLRYLRSLFDSDALVTTMQHNVVIEHQVSECGLKGARTSTQWPFTSQGWSNCSWNRSLVTYGYFRYWASRVTLSWSCGEWVEWTKLTLSLLSSACCFCWLCFRLWRLREKRESVDDLEALLPTYNVNPPVPLPVFL